MSLTSSRKNYTSTVHNPLKPDWFAIFIDAYWTKIKNPETKSLHQLSLFIALGIDLTGTKHILGFWTLKGKESKAKKLFPYAQHQLCLIHLQRNFKAKLNKKLYARAKSVFLKLKTATDRQEGEVLFDKLCEIVKTKSDDWWEELDKKRENYLAFLEYPQEVRKHIYSTNPVESINSGLERMVTELGGYFPSERTLVVEKANTHCKSS